MTVSNGDEKMMPLVPSGAVENEHKHCNPKGEERHDLCKRQHAALEQANLACRGTQGGIASGGAVRDRVVGRSKG